MKPLRNISKKAMWEKSDHNELCEKQPTAKWYLPYFAVVRTDQVTSY